MFNQVIAPREVIYGYEKCSDVQHSRPILGECGIPAEMDGELIVQCNKYTDAYGACLKECEAAGCDLFSVVKTWEGCNCTLKSLQGVLASAIVTADDVASSSIHCNVNTFRASYEFLTGCEGKEICAYKKHDGGTWAIDDVSWQKIDAATCVPLPSTTKAPDTTNLRTTVPATSTSKETTTSEFIPVPPTLHTQRPGTKAGVRVVESELASYIYSLNKE